MERKRLRILDEFYMATLSRSITFVICLCLIVVILISGCTSGMGNSGVVGKWVPTDGGSKSGISNIEFNSDGTCSLSLTHGGGWEGTYKVNGNNIRVSLKFGSFIDFTLSNKNNQIIDENGNSFNKIN